MVEGSEHQVFINEVVLRSQAQAAYIPIEASTSPSARIFSSEGSSWTR
jgi:hypothetical protein